MWILQFVSRKDLGFLLPPAAAAAGTLLIVTAVLSCYALLEAWRVRTEHITVPTEKIAPGMPPVTIVQISDVHVGLIVRERRLRRILAKVSEEEPDLLVSTGDLVDGQINDIGPMAELFRAIEPKYGKFAVTGNHEYYAGLEQALAFTRLAGFTVLRDEGVVLGDTLTLIGLDDRGRNRRQAAVDETGLLRPFAGEKFTLLLKHRPMVDEGSCGTVDLQLSGHTHRGQIFPFGLLTRLFFPLNSGTVRLPGGCLLHVIRGSGTWGPPMRLLSPPEVTVIRLVSAS
jgi:predicted MPP superfamily phosphohydrolase